MKNVVKKAALFALILGGGVSLSACKKDVNFNYDDKVDTSGEYNITPTVQKVDYLSNGFRLKKSNANIILEEGIDDVTKVRLETILKENGFTDYQFSNEQKDNVVNIFVGINGSNGFVDKFMESKHQEPEGLYTQYDAYQIYVNDGIISILGKDLDSAFYGVNTLAEIFDYSNENEDVVLNAKIEDYAITERRGVIEGFYGFPWTTEERVNIMEWGSQYKMNNYVFAPKDDQYHSSKWRDLYPDEELANMKKLVDASIENKVEFTWAIHPFMHGTPFNFDNYDEELKVVKAKFEQLYSIGVRSFALSADDIAVPKFEGDNAAQEKLEWFTKLAENHIKIAKDLLEWTNSLGEPVEWQFVPTTYCGTSDEAMLKYLEMVGHQLPEEYGQHWTGEQVYGTLSNSTVTDFKNRTGRLPVFWLNSPVNDSFGVCENIFMPRMTVLNTDVEQIAGLLVNPSPYPEASKIAIYQALDYSWNIKGFDSAKSYRKSFDSIEPDKDLAEQLYIFASNLQSTEHMSNGWIPQLNKEESPLLIPYIDPLLEKVNDAMIGTDITTYTKPLREEFTKIIDAIALYAEKGNNKELIKDIEPWMNSLRDLIKAGILYLDSVDATAKSEFTQAKELLAQANAMKKSSQTSYKKLIFILESERYVNCATGEVTIQPFYNKLNTQLSAVLAKH